jgi:hypothetical protein
MVDRGTEDLIIDRGTEDAFVDFIDFIDDTLAKYSLALLIRNVFLASFLTLSTFHCRT